MTPELPTWPSFSTEEADAVRAVIMSNKVNYWTGQTGREFEREFAAWTGSHYAVALTNGTVALDLALHALGIGPGDEVVVTPRTFLASVSSVVNCGATPVFADVDCDSGNIEAWTVEPKLTARTKAIVPVHLAGWPCDMPAMMALAQDRGLAVIEDCAQAHGASIDGRMVGSFGDVGAWSFCQDKIMTTGGEGGMVTTDSEDLWRAMWSYKDHGKSWEAVYEREHLPGFRWVHESFGTNWRMLEVQAAIGRIQLTRMADWTARRTRNARAIADVLEDFTEILRTPLPRDGMVHAFYRLYTYVRPDALPGGIERDRIVAMLTEAGVPAMQGSCSEVYLEKAFEGTGLVPAEPCPAARELGKTSIAFLVHPSLGDDDIGRICERTRSVLASVTS